MDRDTSQGSSWSTGVTRNLYIEVTGVAWREGAQWIARCLELDTVAMGLDSESAFDALREAVETQLETYQSLGERDAFLASRNVQVSQLIPDYFEPSPLPRAYTDRDGAVFKPLEFRVPEPLGQVAQVV
jgi:hypothetical protein